MSGTNSLLTGTALILYVAAFLQVRNQTTDVHSNNKTTILLSLLILLALLPHTAITLAKIISTGGLDLSLLYASNYLAVIMTGLVLVCSLKLPVVSLNLLLLPICVVNLLLLTSVDPGISNPIPLEPPQMAHIGLSLTAYACLLTAALQSLLFAVQNNKLKQTKVNFYRVLPPLETMEKLMISMILVGTALLAMSIISGLLFLENMFEQQLTHHIILPSVAWLCYLGLLIGNSFYGWRGDTVVKLNLSAFSFLLLGYVGSKFVLEYLA